MAWCALSSGDLVGEAAFSAAKRYSPLNREWTFHICANAYQNRLIGQTDFPNTILLPGNELGLVSLLALPSLLDIRGAASAHGSLEGEEEGEAREKKKN